MSEARPHLLVVSPHFDDAVFGCGALLAAHRGSVVCTVFSGCPPGHVSTDWDRQCGFENAAQAMEERLHEDERALEILDSHGERAGFLDAQYASYGVAATRQTIAHKLDTSVRRHSPDILLMPLGLFHSDHGLVHEACCDIWLEHRALECLAYEDALYRRIDGRLQGRLAALIERRIMATPLPLHWRNSERHHTTKRQAVKEYASQLAAFGPHGYDDVFCTERCWKLDRIQ